jgi:hypothetical protein
LEDRVLRESFRETIEGLLGEASDRVEARRWYRSEDEFPHIGKTHIAVLRDGMNDEAILDRSNFRSLQRNLEQFFPNEEIDIERGWLIVRALDEAGGVTPVAAYACEKIHELKDYPILNEDDFSEAEREAGFAGTLNAMQSLVRGRECEIESVNCHAGHATLMDGGAVEFYTLGQELGWSVVYSSIAEARRKIGEEKEEWHPEDDMKSPEFRESAMKALDELEKRTAGWTDEDFGLPYQLTDLEFSYRGNWSSDDEARELAIDKFRFLRSGHVLIEWDGGVLYGGDAEECAKWVTEWWAFHHSGEVSKFQTELAEMANKASATVHASPIEVADKQIVVPGDQVEAQVLGEEVTGSYVGGALDPTTIGDVLLNGYMWLAIHADSGARAGRIVFAKSTSVRRAQ